MTDPVTNHGGPGPTHERSDINAAAVLWFGFWLTVSAIIIHLVIWMFMVQLRRDYPSPSTNARSLAPALAPPPPQLQTDPPGDLRRLRAAEENILHQTGWADRAAGTVHIPIKEAMALTAQRGLPKPPPGGTAPQAGARNDPPR